MANSLEMASESSRKMMAFARSTSVTVTETEPFSETLGTVPQNTDGDSDFDFVLSNILIIQNQFAHERQRLIHI